MLRLWGMKMILDDLITDRTAADVALVIELRSKAIAGMSAEELAAYLNGLKGAYNATDLNRVETAVQHVAAALNAWLADCISYAAGLAVAWETAFAPDPAVGTLSIKTNWINTNIPGASNLARYISNIHALNTIGVQDDAPQTMDNLTYQGANAIEALILAVYNKLLSNTDALHDLVSRINAAFVYSGELYGGEPT